MFLIFYLGFKKQGKALKEFLLKFPKPNPKPAPIKLFSRRLKVLNLKQELLS